MSEMAVCVSAIRVQKIVNVLSPRIDHFAQAPIFKRTVGAQYAVIAIQQKNELGDRIGGELPFLLRLFYLFQPVCPTVVKRAIGRRDFVPRFFNMDRDV
jgi:hypothetical protein